MGIFGPKIGEVNTELQEMNTRSAALGYDMWSHAAADLLGKPSIACRGNRPGRTMTARETAEFLKILRERT